jgi:hypothetical protein
LTISLGRLADGLGRTSTTKSSPKIEILRNFCASLCSKHAQRDAHLSSSEKSAQVLKIAKMNADQVIRELEAVEMSADKNDKKVGF